MSSAYYEYLLVMPDGDCKGFNDIELAKGYINLYYEKMIKKYSEKKDYGDFTELPGQVRNNLCQHLGVDEGECVVYKLDDYIDKLREELVFDDEKEDVIEKLISDEIELNVYDYSIDHILHDVETVEVMEPYGEV